MAGAEVKLVPAVLDAMRGKRPSVDWAGGITDSLLDDGLAAQPGSHNIPLMRMLIWLAHEVHGWPVPERLRTRSAVRWWVDEARRQTAGGQFMAGELLSTIYGGWISSCWAGAQKLMGVQVIECWLRGYWALQAIGAVRRPMARYGDGDRIEVAAVCRGARSFKWAAGDKEPTSMDRTSVDLMLAKVAGLPAPSWFTEHFEAAMLDLTGHHGLDNEFRERMAGAIAGDREDWLWLAREAERCIPSGGLEGFTVYAWPNGARLGVLESSLRLSRATAPVYATFAAPGHPMVYLYADSGQRGKGKIKAGKATAIRSGDTWSVIVEREGVELQRVAAQDRTMFRHTKGARGVELPMSLDDALVFRFGNAEARPPEPPRTPETPQPPAVDAARWEQVAERELQSWRAKHGVNSSPEGHLGAIAILAIRWAAGQELDEEMIRKRWNLYRAAS